MMVNKIRPHLMACFTLLLSLLVVTSAQAQTTAYAVTSGNTLISFDVNAPGTPTTIGVIKNTVGNPLAAQIIAIDFRPLTGQLYGLGSDSALYIIDTVTASASQLQPINPPTAFVGNAGFDFDPFADRIRVITDSGQNLHIAPDTSAVGTDLPLNGVAGAVVTGLAYTNNFASPDRETLYGIDSAHGTLVRIGPANSTDGGTCSI